MPGRHGSLGERLWRRINKSGPNGCWIWIGGRNARGYGNLGEGPRCGKTLAAHRVSWMLTNGPIPNGKSVLHKCDNPPCVNPDRLFLGTQLDNMRDRSAKGRAPTGDSNAMRRLRPESKLRAIRIKEAYINGNKNQHELAREFNVDPSFVCLIVNEKRWGGVPRQHTH